MDVPPLTKRGFHMMRGAIDKMVTGMRTPILPWTYQKVINTYTGGKKKLYEAAWQSLKQHALIARDAYAKVFVKMERWNPDDGEKDPRIIQFRNKRFSLSLARWIKPVEHELYKWTPEPNRLRVFSKCLTNEQIARLALAKWNRIGGFALKLDCSRFDAHVRAKALRLEHEVYLRLFGFNPKRVGWWDSVLLALCAGTLAEMLLWQIRNLAKGAGLIYWVLGGRDSGDMNTASGNCLLMVAMTMAAMKSQRISSTDYEMLDNGDDMILFVRRCCLRKLVADFYDMGHELKVEKVISEFEDLEFCHTKPIRTVRGLTMVRDPARVTSHALCGSKYFGDAKSRANLLHTIGSCELSLNAGVPILQSFAKMMLKWGEGGHMLDDASIKQTYAARLDSKTLRTTLPITNEARVSMANAWGVSPAQQLYWEAIFEKHTTVPECFPLQFDIPHVQPNVLDTSGSQ
jgi:hypothetical protein